MKKILVTSVILLTSLSVFAQSSSTGTGTSTVTAETNADAQSNNAGNQQNITFNSGAAAIPEKSIVEYSGTYTLKNTPSVSGPNLTTSNDTCMGSSSGSVNAAGIGFGFGSTWSDENCKRLKMSRELWNKGFRAASLAIDCMTPEAREALEMTGTKCPQSMTEEERRVAFAETAKPDAAAQKSGR
ncbi:hypothetical protein [Hydrogenophaga sp. 2FB]|uniref:hypothetical protein n=1 Tax=Hydrogenophaga sp. 2FB TaxID=2502187 RepID=UPI00207BB769|nr:hypothetical protein [Hydrogenophaga sp. 2FB]